MGHLKKVLCTFMQTQKKCALCTDRVVFLRFVLSSKGVFANTKKVKAIWSQPRTIRKVRSFYGLATFYHRFIKNFSAIMTHITDCLKSEGFQWTPAATKTFLKLRG